MTDEEKIKFLKKMGYNPRLLYNEKTVQGKPTLKKENQKTQEWSPEPEDAKLLLKLNSIFQESK